MAINPTQHTQQAILVTGTELSATNTPVQLELFDEEGNAYDLSSVFSRLEALENPEG